MGVLGKFQSQTFTSWSGLTKDNHLGALFTQQPQSASNLMISLLAFYRGKSLETYLSKFPKKMFDTDDEYTWPIIGPQQKNVPIVEARDENGLVVTPSESTVIGANGTPFYVVFAENQFAHGNVIVGEKNEAYLLRVLGEPKAEGPNTVYKVELMGGNIVGIPTTELSMGKKFSKEYSPVEKEFSRTVGDIHFASSVEMRNEFSQIRTHAKVPGNKLDKKLAFGIPFKDDSGKTIVENKWMHYVEWSLENEFSDEKNTIMMYGRSNRNRNGEYLNIGDSGEVIKMGAGLREQMEYSNVHYYNTFSLDLINDALYSLSAGKLALSDRVFVLETGERGAIQFHEAVKKDVSGWMAISQNNPALIQKVSSPLHSNSLSAGFQFTEWLAPNGVKVSVQVNPFYDDVVRNKILHPNGGVAESYRYDIMYIGSMDQPNIQLAGANNCPEIRSYQWGLRNPFTGQIGNPNMSFDEDSAIMHRMWTGGVMVLDPTRTISIIPAILS